MGEEFKTQRTTKVAACEFPANDGANRTGELNCVNVSLALVYVRRCLLVFCKAKIALLCCDSLLLSMFFEQVPFRGVWTFDGQSGQFKREGVTRAHGRKCQV